MKKNKINNVKIKNIKPILIIIITVLIAFGSIYTLRAISLFRGIETPLRICIALIIIDLGFLLPIIEYKMYFKKAKKIFYILFIIMFIYSLSISFVSYKVSASFNKLGNMTEDNNKETHSTSIVVKKDAKYKDIDDIKDKTIGIITDKNSIAGYNIPHQIIEEEEIDTKNLRDYDDFYSMIDDLLNDKIDAIFLPSGYTTMFSSTDGYENLDTTTKVIYTKETEIVLENIEEEQPDITKPFTILIMGVDTTGTGLTSSFNGDALILLTFNPNTLNTTILSIPRDSYIPISCMGNKKNKITNAGWYGESCIIKSLENYFELNIDYYFKVNFKAVVDLVDAIGGVEVDVPYSFCEQNSNRQWGKKTIFVNAGKQTLNGEQALAFARHRKVTDYMVNYCGSKYVQNAGYWNDYTRGQNQQIIIKAVLKKLADKATSFSVIENLLDTISKNAKTNMNTNTMLSLYNIGKDIIAEGNTDQALNMQRLYLNTYDARVYWDGCGNVNGVYVGGIYDKSYEAVSKAMRVNLELEKPTIIKDFSFSIKNKYEETVIGKGLTSGISIKTMPNLIGQSESYARSFALSNNITINVNYIEGTVGQTIGTITNQSIKERTDLSTLSGKTLTIDVISTIQTPTVPEEPEIPGLPDGDDTTTDPEPIDPTTPDQGTETPNPPENNTEENQI